MWRRLGVAVLKPSLNELKVADCCCATEIEFVLAAADEAGVSALSSAGVRLTVFDRHTLTKFLPTCGCGRSLAKALLQELVIGDLDRAASIDARVGALRPQRAYRAGLGGELDLGAKNDRLLFPGC